MIAIYLTGLGTVLLLLVPFLPGLRGILSATRAPPLGAVPD
jgi:hypothetical protein